jgi:uracil-DNA glycosylase
VSDFDIGYAVDPYTSLVRRAPGAEAYPAHDFRLEWGPIFHRGRLDGSARLLAIGQDPAAHEAIARRILVGEAGQRVQAFLAHLGLHRSYVMLNTFLYSVYGQQAGEHHVGDPEIAAYRHDWLEALLATGRVEAVVAFGRLADTAWQRWRAASGAGADLPYAAVPHPTQPESSSGGDPEALAEAFRRMLVRWNAALDLLHPQVHHPDEPAPLVHFDEGAPPETVPIPAADLPAGCPTWMTSVRPWAQRSGADAEEKRATIVVTVPDDERPWH